LNIFFSRGLLLEEVLPDDNLHVYHPLHRANLRQKNNVIRALGGRGSSLMMVGSGARLTLPSLPWGVRRARLHRSDLRQKNNVKPCFRKRISNLASGSSTPNLFNPRPKHTKPVGDAIHLRIYYPLQQTMFNTASANLLKFCFGKRHLEPKRSNQTSSLGE